MTLLKAPAFSLSFSGLTLTATLMLADVPELEEEDPDEDCPDPDITELLTDLLRGLEPGNRLGDFVGRVGRPMFGHLIVLKSCKDLC